MIGYLANDMLSLLCCFSISWVPLLILFAIIYTPLSPSSLISCRFLKFCDPSLLSIFIFLNAVESTICVLFHQDSLNLN